jgi:hypothetical protein
MRRLVEKLQAEVKALFARRDAPWLLVSCADADVPIVFKVLRDCERTSRDEIFLLLGAPFVNPQQYAAAAVSQFVREYQALCAELAERQLPPPASLPDRLLDDDDDDQLPPAQRLSALLAAAELLLPTDKRLLCALWPLTMTDPAAYAGLLDALLPMGSCTSQVCLIGRELVPGKPQSASRVVRIACDFGPAAVARSLQEASSDETQPEAVRMNALLMLAQLDQAHGRTDAAIGKFHQVLAYHKAQRNAAMQTVVLLQLGETHHRLQRLSQARACYEQALTPAAALAPTCVAQLARNLGDIASLEQRHADAAVCYRTWHRVACRLGDQTGAAAALEKLALAQRRKADRSPDAQKALL